MTEEELFDAYRQVVSERDQLRMVGDAMWGAYWDDEGIEARDRWAALRGINTEPPVEQWINEC